MPNLMTFQLFGEEGEKVTLKCQKRTLIFFFIAHTDSPAKSPLILSALHIFLFLIRNGALIIKEMKGKET